MIINNVSDIGKIIKEIRKKQNLTQPQLAATSGVGVRFIVDLEKGKETAAIGKTLKVIKMLGIDIEFKLPKMNEE
ncbi:MAG: helix-turn-helix transcriptional regulator [Elusimicrobiota bacterium]|jgi:y4mF family transcriptional regulator|nr:helix-turn-helix transcriptional regulator [Elusimicrobiota bacterium]